MGRLLPGAGTLLALLAAAVPAAPAAREYGLVIEERAVTVAGRTAPGMTINGGIPGPVLRFSEGDMARIRVENRMSEETSIHWHGILVPPGMDGVPNLTFPPIAPGAAFTYEFPIRQSGTYWYHSHSGHQEQLGVYGAIVVAPRGGAPPAVRDAVVLLSDWTSRPPHEVDRMLRRGSEWFALEKGAAQSVAGAARAGRLGAFFRRELQRMPPMDIADVAYDAFLVNGSPETAVDAAPGETLRIRIVDGSATTFFHLEFAGGTLEVVSADGQDVQPLLERRLLIAVADTYDVLVRVPGPGAWELRATAHDGSGHASIWIGSGERHPAPEVPRPDLYADMGHGTGLGQLFALTPEGVAGMPDRDVDAGRFDRPGMMGMEGMAQAMGTAREREQAAERFFAGEPAPLPPLPAGTSTAPPSGRRYGHRFGLLDADISTAALATDGSDERPWPPYARLRAAAPTLLPADRPVREIRVTLDGDMKRYVWFLDERASHERDDFVIRAGEVVRLIMVNRTMMHHPMHLHGHFFRVVNGQGDRAPLKHTVDVPPMSTTVIEFAADEPGDWLFHCHLLYHMMNGMAGVVSYDGFDPGPGLAALRPRLHPDHWVAWGSAAMLSQMAEARLEMASTRWTVSASAEAGWHHVAGAQREGLLAVERYVNGFWSLFAGAHVESGGPTEARGVAGLRTVLPLGIELAGWADTGGGARATLEKSLPLTPRLEFAGAATYDTEELWAGRLDLAFLVSPAFSVVARWHSDFGWGAGAAVRF